jgi:hypothetical protein
MRFNAISIIPNYFKLKFEMTIYFSIPVITPLGQGKGKIICGFDVTHYF